MLSVNTFARLPKKSRFALTMGAAGVVVATPFITGAAMNPSEPAMKPVAATGQATPHPDQEQARKQLTTLYTMTGDSEAGANAVSAKPATAPKAAAPAKPKAKAPAKPKAKAKAPAAKTNAISADGYTKPVTGPLGTSFGTGGKLWSSGSHTGQDFVVSTGTPIKSIADGKVVRVSHGGAYGNEVVIRHADGKYSQYAHMSSVAVSNGAKVKAGQRIGAVGATGNVTGPHLHFEVRTTPNYGSGINPVTYLRGHGVSI